MRHISDQCRLAICVISLAFSGALGAQTPAADPGASAPAQPAATAKKMPKKPFMAKSAAGKACSAQADAQNLRGKARKKFRADCMKAK